MNRPHLLLRQSQRLVFLLLQHQHRHPKQFHSIQFQLFVFDHGNGVVPRAC
jgi:hypothetical protein